MYAASIGSEVTPLRPGYACQSAMNFALAGVSSDWK